MTIWAQIAERFNGSLSFFLCAGPKYCVFQRDLAEADFVPDLQELCFIEVAHILSAPER